MSAQSPLRFFFKMANFSPGDLLVSWTRHRKISIQLNQSNEAPEKGSSSVPTELFGPSAKYKTTENMTRVAGPSL